MNEFDKKVKAAMTLLKEAYGENREIHVYATVNDTLRVKTDSGEEPECIYMEEGPLKKNSISVTGEGYSYCI